MMKDMMKKIIICFVMIVFVVISTIIGGKTNNKGYKLFLEEIRYPYLAAYTCSGSGSARLYTTEAATIYRCYTNSCTASGGSLGACSTGSGIKEICKADNKTKVTSGNEYIETSKLSYFMDDNISLSGSWTVHYTSTGSHDFTLSSDKAVHTSSIKVLNPNGVDDGCFTGGRSGKTITVTKKSTSCVAGDYTVSVTLKGKCPSLDSKTATAKIKVEKPTYNYYYSVTAKDASKNIVDVKGPHSTNSQITYEIKLGSHSDNMQEDDYTLEIYTMDGAQEVLVNELFTINGSNGNYTATNSIAIGDNFGISPGKYYIRLKYKNSNGYFGSGNGNGLAETEFMNEPYDSSKTIKTMYRYANIISTTNYDIRVTGYRNTNGTNMVYFEEKNSANEWISMDLPVEKFKQTYGSIDFNSIDFINGDVVVKPVCPANTICTTTTAIITAYDMSKEEYSAYREYYGKPLTEEELAKVAESATYIIYTEDGGGTKQIATSTKFAEMYPSLYSILYESGMYGIDPTTKKLYYINSGVGTKRVVEHNPMEDKQRTPLSTTGGYIVFDVDLSVIPPKERPYAKYQLYYVPENEKNSAGQMKHEFKVYNDQNEATSDVYRNEDDSVIATFNLWTGNDMAKFKLEFPEANESVKGTYYLMINRRVKKWKFFTGPYYVHEPITQSNDIQFVLSDGILDYYLYNEVDRAELSNDPLTSEYPNSNKKYKNQVGFYLYKGGQEQIAYNLNTAPQIYTERARRASDNSIEYYKEVNYKLQFKSITGSGSDRVYTFRPYELVGKNYVDVGEDEVVTEAEIRNTDYKYKAVADQLKYLTQTSTGVGFDFVNSDIGMSINSLTPSDNSADVVINYTLKGATTSTTELLSKFKTKYPKAYELITINFIMDISETKNLVPGYVQGFYQITTENGKKIEGKNVTNDFKWVISKGKIDENGNLISSSENDNMIINIVPKNEVEPGEYYVYVPFGDYTDPISHLNYANNEAEEADMVFSRELFPEFWNRNTHMTIIKYSEPKYEIEYDIPVYKTNITREDGTINTVPLLYTNVDGEAEFNVKLDYIYDAKDWDNSSSKKFVYSIDYKNGDTWEPQDITSNNRAFDIVTDFKKTPDVIVNNNKLVLSIPQSKLTINTHKNKIKKGTYRVTIKYMDDTKELTSKSAEFVVEGEYYKLEIKEGFKENFVRNIPLTESLKVIGGNIKAPENVNFVVEKMLDDGSYSPLIVDKINKTISAKSAENTIKYFDYNFTYASTGQNENEVLFNFELTNVPFAAPAAKYRIVFKYSYDGGEEVEVIYDFEVLKDSYDFVLGSTYTPNVTVSGLELENDATAHYFTYDDLDDINYKIMMVGVGAQGIDVSSKDSQNRMFVISDSWESRPESGEKTSYKGKIFIKLNDSLVDFDGKYVLVVQTNNIRKEFNLPNLREAFDWNISSLEATSAYKQGDGTYKDVNGYYKNLSGNKLVANIESNYKTPPKYIITRDCQDFDESCNLESIITFNDRFEIDTKTDSSGNIIDTGESPNTLKIRIKEGITSDKVLPKGDYVFIAYYSMNNYRRARFKVLSEYAYIDFDENNAKVIANIDSTREVSGNIFSNKNGYIELPVIIEGIEYSEPAITITNQNGTENFNDKFIFNSSLLATDHIVKFTYDSTGNERITPGTYRINAKYVNDEQEITEDNYYFTVYGTYFDYTISNPEYSPCVAVPNRSDIKIRYKITTDELLGNGDTFDNEVKSTFIRNLKIETPSGTDVTNKIKAVYEDTLDDQVFDIVLTYDKNTLTPGKYNVTVTYEQGDFKLEKVVSFDIKNPESTLTIKDVEVVSDASDGKMHNNVKGHYKVLFETEGIIYTTNYEVRVEDEDGNDVTSKFSVIKEQDNSRIYNEATEPFIDAGDYKILVKYTDEVTGNITTTSKNVKMLGKFKNIKIYNLQGSTSNILADIDGQSYTYKLDTSNLSAFEIENIKTRVYDRYGNILYTNIPGEKCNNNADGKCSFGFEKINDLEYKINILANKARVGVYYIAMSLPDEGNDYFDSNKLPMEIHGTSHNVELLESSSLAPLEVYNGEENKFYDLPGFTGTYVFNSDFNIGQKYTIKVFNNGVLINEMDYLDMIYGESSISTPKFGLSNLGVGEIDVAICVNGLPYDSKTFTTDKYIKITEVVLALNNKTITDSATLNYGETKEFDIIVRPENATNKELTFTSLNPNVVTTNGRSITSISSGEAIIRVKNFEYSKDITIKVDERIASDKYEINHTDHTIFINSLNSKTVTKAKFLENIKNLSSSFKLYNAKGTNITDSSNTVAIGTNFRLVNANETYYIILIGDLNCNGTIDIGDVSYIYQIYRKKVNVTDSKIEKAAHVRKANDIQIGDVSKEYQFYRGKRNEL